MAFRPPTPGALLDNKYRLAERIGGGGMGDVYRADNLFAGRSVAIKFLHGELAQSPEIADRFFREAQAVNRIRHPNIVDVLDAGDSDMGPYLVMEFLDGQSVGMALSRLGKFDQETAIATTVPVLDALDAAHRAGIIHRDLKPENVFIAFDSSRNQATVRLLDFGIAKVLDSGSGQNPRTRTGVVFGTPDYLSPEQATGEGTIDGRSDLFSVGVMLFELLTGSRPFKAPTAVATAFRVVHAEAPPLTASGITVDARLEAAVGKLLQKEASKRFASAGDVSRELGRIVPDPVRRREALGRVINADRRGANTNDRRGRPSSTDVFAAPTRIGVQGRAEIPSPSPPIARASSPGGPPDSRRPHDIGAPPVRAPQNPRGELAEIAARLGAEAARAQRPPVAVRAFPERFSGRYQVRGPVLRSVDRAVIDRYGRPARDEIVANMPEPYAEDFHNDSINALVAYDLEALDVFLELATTLVVRDPAKWREFGRESIDGELNNVVRTLLRPAPDLASVVRRGVTIWARLFSFGSWRVATTATGKVTLHIGEVDPASAALRLWLLGVVEQTARRALSTSLTLTVVQGEAAFAPDLVCEIG